jgi:hypothetical protein
MDSIFSQGRRTIALAVQRATSIEWVDSEMCPCGNLTLGFKMVGYPAEAWWCDCEKVLIMVKGEANPFGDTFHAWKVIPAVCIRMYPGSEVYQRGDKAYCWDYFNDHIVG